MIKKLWPASCGILAVFAFATTCQAKSSISEISYPSLFYSSSDRERLRYFASGDPNDTLWLAKKRFGGFITSGWTSRDTREEEFAGPDAWEGARASMLFHKAVALWMNPYAVRDRSLVHDPRLRTYADLVRRAIDNITGPEGLTRRGDAFLVNGKPSKWARFLEASLVLCDYAKAVDILLVPEVRSAVGEEHIQKMYSLLVDGIFHLLAAHIRGAQSGVPRNSNNWSAIELAGTGLLGMAFRELLEAEPHGSQRYVDYEFVTQNVPRLMNQFLQTWSEPGDRNYYYEGPHYTSYFELPAAAYVRAYLKVHGRSSEYPALSFDESQPLIKFAKGQSALLVPYEKTANVVKWCNIDFDDSWYGEIGPLQIRLAAWTKDSNPGLSASLLNSAGYAAPPWGGFFDDLTLATTVEDDLSAARKHLSPLETSETLTNAVALARTGSALDGSDLTVALKNTLTLPFSPTQLDVPALGTHCHADAGNVAIYRGAEPIALIPGYGEGGAAGKNHSRFYGSWLHQNVLEVFDPAGGYPENVLQALGDVPGPDPFVIPWHVAGDASHTESHEMSDSFGRYWVLSTDMTDAHSKPLLTRSVVLDDSKQYVLVIDRLQTPSRVRVQWNGNGLSKNNTASYASEGNDTLATFTGGASFDTRFKVISKSPMEASGLDGKFNPAWNDLKHEITTVRSTSSSEVWYVLSLIEMAPKGGSFRLDAKPTVDSSGRLTGVTVLNDGVVKFRLRIDRSGMITRSE